MMTVDLSVFPRRQYTQDATPIERLPHFSRALGDVDIFIKRDDRLGLTCGGNKTRKLEFLMADALEKEADVIITCGAVQSNHCRLTLAAAIQEGLPCHLLLEEKVPNSYHPKAGGSLFLVNLMGAERVDVFPAGTDMMAEMQKAAKDLMKKGHRPYIIPFGGSNEIGALGYVACAQEMVEQMNQQALDFDHIVLATGSTASYAGLLAGFICHEVNIPVTGMSINKKQAEQQPAVYGLVVKTLAKLGKKMPFNENMVKVDDRFIGPGYALPSEDMVRAVRLLAKTEGILLDPVYTGKAMAGLMQMIQEGAFFKGAKVLFIHTGGLPALFAFERFLTED